MKLLNADAVMGVIPVLSVAIPYLGQKKIEKSLRVSLAGVRDE